MRPWTGPPKRRRTICTAGPSSIGRLRRLCLETTRGKNATCIVVSKPKIRQELPAVFAWEWRETLHRPTSERIEVRYQ